MRAVIWTAYGDPEVLKVREVDRPVANHGDVLVNVRASAVTTGDCRLRGFRVPVGLWLPTRLAFGLSKPRRKIPGMDFSGVVVAVGEGVDVYQPGDRVLGSTGMALGANAEYVCIGQHKAIAKIPESLSCTDAASLIFGGLTALHFLGPDNTVVSSHKVLVNGASGSVGCAAIQLAKYLGAEVTAVCSAGNHELVGLLGADHVVDYNSADFTRNGVIYDIILDAVGNLSYSICRESLAPSGQLILINVGLWTMLRSLFGPRVVCGVAGESAGALQKLVDLHASGHLRPVVDRIYPLDQVVQAHGYVDRGHKKGNVVLT